jgi:hypothetical protein
MSNRRPRRSRIYDLNYNIGENYYKSAIDRLDEKTSRTSLLTRRSEPPISSPPKSRFLTQLSNDGGLDEDTLDFARDRASKVIQRETILDQRTGRKALELEADFDSQVSRTLDRIQASKKLLSSIDVDNSYDNEATSSSTYVKKRVLKVTSDVTSSSAAASSANDSMVKWSKYGSSNADDSESYAALRAKQTKARLQDIEQDMVDRSERQLMREQRSANLKKLLAESNDLADDFGGISNGVSSIKITKRTAKQITSY